MATTATNTDNRLSAVDKYFMITARGSNYSREIRGGFALNALPPSPRLWPVF